MEETRVTYTKLRKKCKESKNGLIPYKLAVIGDCATQYLVTAIEGYGHIEGYGFTIFEADYNQIEAQIMDHESDLYQFTPQSIVLYMCIQKLHDAYCVTSVEKRERFAEDIKNKICSYWKRINQSIKANILQLSFSYENDGIFGNGALREKTSFSYQLVKLNYLLLESASSFKNIYWIDLDDLRWKIVDSKFYDTRLYYIAKMPISMDALPKVAESILDVIKAIDGKIKKCIILDLDNTLWGGTIGDDGIENIQIGELGQGHAFSEFQTWLKELKKRGILLAVCSKNQEHLAKEPFQVLSEMILRLDDFSMFVANWKDKVTNIQFIQKRLNIGMDSVVFIDDNPFEREQVKKMLPEVTVPDLPENPECYVEYLKSLNLFEAISFSSEDIKRTQQYQAEEKREELKETFSSYQEYLQELEMVSYAAPFDKLHYSRIAQLTQRSNQFNLRTIRYTEQEVQEVAENEQFFTFYFCLQDKFGKHGLVSVVVLEKQTDHVLFITEWLMSCRVLKRGMEEFIINKIIYVAKRNGYKKVIGEYKPTSKNQMVEKIYSKLGFQDKGNNIFEAEVEDFLYNKTYIKEMEYHG